MPIKLTLLENKNIKTYFDEKEYVGNNQYPKLDLRSNLWKIDYDKIIIDDYIEVDKSTEMRIDTIARYLLGSEDVIDVIVKFNKLQNPYGIKEGDVILIPNLSSFFQNISRVNYKPKDINRVNLSNDNRVSGNNVSISVKSGGKGTKTYSKGSNGVIVF